MSTIVIGEKPELLIILCFSVKKYYLLQLFIQIIHKDLIGNAEGAYFF